MTGLFSVIISYVDHYPLVISVVNEFYGPQLLSLTIKSMPLLIL